MAIKKVGFTKSSALTVNRVTQLPVTGAVCRLLATHFSQANNIQTPLLKQYVYNDDATKTNILIQPHYKFLTAITQMRPALIVKRGTVSSERIAIDDGYIESMKSGMSKNVFLNGTHTIFCISGQGGSTELLGAEVFQVLLEFAPIIQEDFELMKFDITSISEVSKLEEFDQHFVVTITITWVKQNVWSIRGDGPWLQDLATDSQLL
jgi:hypothetical protein